MSSNLVIRRAKDSDLPAINRLLRQVLEVHAEGRPDVFKSGGKKYSDSEILEIIGCDDTPVYEAVDSGEVLGYAFCEIKCTEENAIKRARRSLFIEDFCVDESARGRGVGSALFDYVKGVALDGGFDSVTLNVWSFNETAVKFYESRGMSPLSTIMELKI